nr:dynamin family protein [Maliibacterium massiliense]
MQDSISYRNMEFELYGNLVQMKNILSYYAPEDPIISEIAGCLEQIKTRTYNVAVMGEFRRGKSSLINALLGLKVLPADVTPTTATINRITFGTEPEVVLHFKDARSQRIRIDELQDYVTKITEEQEKVARSIREAVVYYPTVICQNHVDIIDTPGLNDDADMTQTTIGLLHEIDAVIVAVSALSPFSQSESSFVADLIASPSVHNIVFVITFIDQIEPEDFPRLFDTICARIDTMVRAEVEARYSDRPDILEKARHILGEKRLRIFAVSAYQALRSFVTNDRKLLKASRFPVFKEQLYALLTAQQSVHIVQRTYEMILKAARKFDEIYQNKFAIISGNIDRLQDAQRDSTAYFEERAAHIEQAHARGDARLVKLVEGVPAFADAGKAAFIKALAAVGKNDAQTIRAAILQGQNDAQAALEKACAQLLAVLEGCFADAVLDVFDFRERKLCKPLEEHLPGLLTNNDALLSETEAAMASAGKLPRFAWCEDCAPKVANLAHANVIVHIGAVLRHSLARYASKLKTYIAARWEPLLTAGERDAAKRETIEKCLAENLQREQNDLLVCKGNYQLHKDMVELLVQSTTRLRQQVE